MGTNFKMGKEEIIPYNTDDNGAISLEEFRESRFTKAPTEEDLVFQYANLLDSRKKYGEENALYETLCTMERRSPSISRVRKEVDPPYDRGIITGRFIEKDFTPTHSLYVEDGEVTPELKEILDRELENFDTRRNQLVEVLTFTAQDTQKGLNEFPCQVDL